MSRRVGVMQFAKQFVRILFAAGFVCAMLATASRAQSNPPAPAPAPTAPPAAPAPPAKPVTNPSVHYVVSPLESALEMLRDGDYAPAADAYNKIIASGANLPAAYTGLARAKLGEKDVAGAYDAASKAVSLNPNFQDGHVALGEVYFRQGKLSEAEKEWVGVANSGHATARAYLGLYRISIVTSNFKSAKDRIDRAHYLDPNDPDIWHEWANTLSRSQRLKELQEFMAKRQGNPDELKNISEYLAILTDESRQPTRTCSVANDAKSTETALESLRYGPADLRGFGLNVRLNGVNSRLLIDTGAGGIIVDQHIAEKAGITHIVDSKTGGIGDKGDVSGYIGFAKSIQVGGVEFRDCYIKVYGKRSVQGDDGLIGTNVFAGFLIDLDFPNGKLKLGPLPPEPPAPAAPNAVAQQQPEHHDATPLYDRYIAPEMQSFTRIFRFGHMLLIPTSVNDSPARLFLIDTGGWDNMVTPPFARETTKVHQADDITITGLSGAVKKVYTVDHAKIVFAHFKQERENLVAFDLTPISDDVGTEISGTLGFNMLAMLDMKIDYRDGLIDFVYDKKRFH